MHERDLWGGFFDKRQANLAKLAAAGFELRGELASGGVGERLAYTQEILGGEFELEVLVNDAGRVSTSLHESDTGDEYVLYKTSAEGTSQGTVCVVNLRVEPFAISETLAQEGFFPGWHMNKKHWYSVILDEALPDGDLLERVAVSYALAGRK